MTIIGHKTNDLFGTFSEYSIKGIPKKTRRIVIQKGKDQSHPFYGIWYVYDVTKELVTTIDWSNYQWKAEEKARAYIRKINL